MRIVYLGTPEFAVRPLNALHQAGYEIAAVVTQPDRPRHRGLLQPTPVKAAAARLDLPVLTPERVNRPESLAALRALHPDLLVVVAYGQLLSEDLLAIPPLGALNIHGSLLPAYRGAAPIQRAVLNGERKSGVTVMYLDKGMDSGDTIVSAAVPIGENMTAGELAEELCALGSGLLLQVCAMLARGGRPPRAPQNHALASFAPLLKKEDELVEWMKPARAAHNKIRGLNPAPGAYTLFQGKRLKLWQSSLADDDGGAADPGQVLGAAQGGLLVKCGAGALYLLEVQPEGKGRMDGASFARGYGMRPGLRLG